MAYTSFSGFQYAAMELNIACPRGLSGGPLFRVSEAERVMGLVTENLESTTALDEVEVVSSQGMVERTEARKVITYGVALRLGAVADWLDERVAAHVPPHFPHLRRL